MEYVSLLDLSAINALMISQRLACLFHTIKYARKIIVFLKNNFDIAI